MNDFTKAELEQILDDLDDQMSNYLMADNEFNRNLRDKTQRMIDNYCEHKNTIMDCDGGISLVCVDCKDTVMDI